MKLGFGVNPKNHFFLSFEYYSLKHNNFKKSTLQINLNIAI